MLNIFYAVFLILSIQDSPTTNQVDENVNGKWKIVQDKSSFEFKISAMWLFPVTGVFSGVNGTIEISKDIYKVKVDLTIDPSTIDTGNKKRDDHLRSEDFFDVDTYSLISFTASRITAQATDRQYLVEGQLTIKDVTKSIQVPITLEGFNDQGEIIFIGSKNINRREFNIDYSGRGVADAAELDFSIVATRFAGK